ncbi:hypothetical protein CDO52_00070 [Nocardiopsis gilva YIM 90087]|uniref:XRE family transcriptional regulator n=1 Tax=Nocardiopsis gilva YIM 90087 TaxID=1235441 RepID=A0A223RZW6_9ACTN|nr:hypothetical protein [Nocardiopsis gilva]ASU81387.1 hypothetical protein CDO52_00070 [Nocardiopsis gilva YIM 90087]
MTAAGLTTHTARGRALGVSHTTAMRVGTGEMPPSASMIARALLALNCRFDDLFEVVEVD